MGKRLFLAVDVDQQVRDSVGRISSDLRQRLAPRIRLTWVKPERMHLTLHFFASADAALEGRMHAALADPIPHAAFNLSFDGLGVFPERGSPRVLWLGIRDGAGELRHIQKLLAVRLSADARSEPANSGETFTPHLTLARMRDRVRPGQISEITAIPASAGPCLIDRVTLYESRLSPAGPTYLRLAEAPLIPSG